MSHPSPAKIYHYISRVSVFISFFFLAIRAFVRTGVHFETDTLLYVLCFECFGNNGLITFMNTKIPHNRSLCSVFILPYWYFSINVWLKYCGFCKNFLIHFFSLYISIGQRSSKSIGFRNHVVLFWRRALAKYQSVEKYIKIET